MNHSYAALPELLDIVWNLLLSFALYRLDKDHKKVELYHAGQASKFGSIFAQGVAEQKKHHIYSSGEIAEKLQGMNLQEAVNEMNAVMTSVSPKETPGNSSQR